LLQQQLLAQVLLVLECQLLLWGWQGRQLLLQVFMLLLECCQALPHDRSLELPVVALQCCCCRRCCVLVTQCQVLHNKCGAAHVRVAAYLAADQQPCDGTQGCTCCCLAVMDPVHGAYLVSVGCLLLLLGLKGSCHRIRLLLNSKQLLRQALRRSCKEKKWCCMLQWCMPATGAF
jgi:hypothetical protein